MIAFPNENDHDTFLWYDAFSATRLTLQNVVCLKSLVNTDHYNYYVFCKDLWCWNEVLFCDVLTGKPEVFDLILENFKSTCTTIKAVSFEHRRITWWLRFFQDQLADLQTALTSVFLVLFCLCISLGTSFIGDSHDDMSYMVECPYTNVHFSMICRPWSLVHSWLTLRQGQAICSPLL